jgi:hypothetical protein
MSEFKRFLLIWFLIVLSAGLFGVGAYFSWTLSIVLFMCILPDSKLPKAIVRNKKIYCGLLVALIVILLPLQK